MKRQPKVVWTKGMFLSPQHFQAQDRYFEELAQFRFAASNYANYGVTQIALDNEALSNGRVKLLSARGILPDGEIFDMPDSDELPPSREIGKLWPSTDQTLDVYLALPETRINARNVTLPGQRGDSGPADTRYTSETRNVPDANQGADEKPVQVAQKTFRLLFGTEFRDGYSSIRVAQLERSATGAALRADFVPPCLDIASSDFLLNLLRRQVEVLLTKSASLGEGRRQTGKSAANFTASEIDKFWLLHTVNSYLPELKHIFKTRHGHPEAAFVAMLRLAGGLATFASKGGPGDFPDYDHDNLGPCFRDLDARIRDLMEVALPSKYAVIPLTLTDRYVWTGSVNDDTFFRIGKFYLSISARMGVGELIQKVPQFVKVSAPQDMDKIVVNALAGVGLIHTQVAPQGAPTKLDNQYFQIDGNGTLWERIMLSRRIAVSAPAEIVDPKMEVIVVWD